MPVIRPLPTDTNKLVRQHLTGCRNLGLVLDKYNPWQQQRNGRWDLAFEIDERGRRKVVTSGEAKRFWLSDGVDDNRLQLADTPLYPNTRIDPDHIAANYDRWQNSMQSVGAMIFVLTTAGRLVVGLGSESTLETSMTFHATYGYPTIPGSALKGLARAVALFSVADDLGIISRTPEQMSAMTDKQASDSAVTSLLKLLESTWESKPQLQTLLDNLKAANQQEVPRDAPARSLTVESAPNSESITRFRSIFGHTKEAGRVVFYDAVPTSAMRFDLDIMNPHYPDYYKDDDGRVAPSDDQSPNPVSFLTVAAGLPFGFALGARRSTNPPPAAEINAARQWLEDGLRHVGIGAKTGSGYGIFE